MSKWIIITLAAVLGSVALAGPAMAQAPATFQVSITVENDCDILADDLDFGTVSDLTPNVPGSSTVTVTCTGLDDFTVAFDVGTGGGSLTTRLMDLAGTTVAYNLYRDALFTEILGDGTGGTLTIGATSTGGPDVFTVFGRTEAGQNPKPPGTYTSTVTATVTF